MDIDVPFKELGTVNSAALSAAVKKLDERAWIDCDIRQKSYDVHRQTRSIVLVFAQGWPDIHVGKYSGWNLLAGVAMPVVNEVIEHYYPPGGDIIRLMVANLVAGGSIDEHYDADPSFALGHRIHVPLQTNPDVRFLIEGRRYVMDEGKAYEINNLKFHAVHNEGTEDRHHLIFDYGPPH
jgi:hypothetical protein